LLFDPGKPAEIADALEQLATDTDLRERLRQLGLEHAAKFTWARSVEETIRVWQGAIASRHG
jgi:glycosyltransferase involved in cell wall biosynthesis